jgi:hypothetical protein
MAAVTDWAEKPRLPDGIAARVLYNGVAVEFYEPMTAGDLAALLNLCRAKVFPAVPLAEKDERFELVMERRKETRVDLHDRNAQR